MLTGMPPIRGDAPAVPAGPNDIVERDSDEADATADVRDTDFSSPLILIPSGDEGEGEERREEGAGSMNLAFDGDEDDEPLRIKRRKRKPGSKTVKSGAKCSRPAARQPPPVERSAGVQRTVAAER